MGRYRIIDSHAHCGVEHVAWGWEKLAPRLENAGISGVGLMAPVEDIYDRYDRHFPDSPAWQACRRRANEYVASRPAGAITVYPYFFVWNDFAAGDLGPDYVAIKWHRHADEPEYAYDDPRCGEFIGLATALGLPILLEETAANTRRFIEALAPAAIVIIPHLGLLNGGFATLEAAGVFANPQVWADTALAPSRDILTYIERHGRQRLLFGSDFPFGHPAAERDKILDLGLDREVTQAILADNWLRLMDGRERVGPEL